MKTNSKISLTEIAKQYKIDPKIARRRIRKSAFHKTANGWVFPIAKRAEVVKIVKG